jgi:hypothetical protein
LHCKDKNKRAIEAIEKGIEKGEKLPQLTFT